MRKKDWKRRLCEQASGGPAENEFPETRVTVSSHYQHIGIARLDMGFEHVADGTSFRGNPVQNNLEAVPGQIPGQLFGGALGIDGLFSRDGHDANMLRLFEQRNRVGYRPGGRLAEIPGNDNGPEPELT